MARIKVLERDRNVYLNKYGEVVSISYLNKKANEKYQKEVVESILASLGTITDSFIIDYKDVEINLTASIVNSWVRKYFGKFQAHYKVTLKNKSEEYLKKET